MTPQSIDIDRAAQERWLTLYYFVRAGFSAAWVAVALVFGQRAPGIAAVLLVGYPAWDAFANLLDAARSGGLGANRTQALNAGVGLVTALAVLVMLADMHRVLGVFGVWAILSGLLQLGTALRRWKRFGAQWAMVLSGAQSALAGGFFIAQAQMPATPSIANVAGYAGVGAVYFLISALWLSVRAARRRTA